MREQLILGFGELTGFRHDCWEYVSCCEIPLMRVVYQVVGFGRGDGATRVVTGRA